MKGFEGNWRDNSYKKSRQLFQPGKGTYIPEEEE